MDSLCPPIWLLPVDGFQFIFFVPCLLRDGENDEYDSYLDERGRGKAKKLANIAIYRLFDRMCVSFGVAIIACVNRFGILCP